MGPNSQHGELAPARQQLRPADMAAFSLFAAQHLHGVLQDRAKKAVGLAGETRITPARFERGDLKGESFLHEGNGGRAR